MKGVFVPGQRVHVASLGTGIVREVRGRDRYVVELKGRSLVLAGAQLQPAPDVRAPRQAQTPQEISDSGIAPSLDLHGKTAPEALEALDRFISDALVAGAAEARVIHGRSGGRLKAVVHARLRQLPPVRTFRVDPSNPGVTIVRF